MKTINPILIIPCPLTPTAPPHLLRSASVHSTVTLRIGHPSRTWPPYKIHFKVLDGTFIEISLWGKKLSQTHIHTINQCPDSCGCDNQLWQRGNACSHWVQLCWCVSNFHQHNFVQVFIMFILDTFTRFKAVTHFVFHTAADLLFPNQGSPDKIPTRFSTHWKRSIHHKRACSKHLYKSLVSNHWF